MAPETPPGAVAARMALRVTTAADAFRAVIRFSRTATGNRIIVYILSKQIAIGQDRPVWFVAIQAGQDIIERDGIKIIRRFYGAPVLRRAVDPIQAQSSSVHVAGIGPVNGPKILAQCGAENSAPASFRAVAVQTKGVIVGYLGSVMHFRPSGLKAGSRIVHIGRPIGTANRCSGIVPHGFSWTVSPELIMAYRSGNGSVYRVGGI